ncbi:MAG: YigZ family protein [Gemmatimonadota bacterium]
MTGTPSRYPIPSRPHRVEEVIQKSRFITAAGRAPDSEAAHAFLDLIRGEFPDATHHCWAFVAGPPGSTTSIGMSDDGEPHGTAGRPMLTALLHGGVGEIVAVCTRYYGGTKLGTGGLSRAYSGGVKLLLESLPTEERIERIALRVVVDYGSVDALQRLLEETESLIVSQEFGKDVEYRVAVPVEHAVTLAEAVAGVTRGQGIVQPA